MQVFVEAGQTVTAGTPLVMVEAMKTVSFVLPHALSSDAMLTLFLSLSNRSMSFARRAMESSTE